MMHGNAQGAAILTRCPTLGMAMALPSHTVSALLPAPNVWRFFERFSSRLHLRSSMTFSSRFLLASSRSRPALLLLRRAFMVLMVCLSAGMGGRMALFCKTRSKLSHKNFHTKLHPKLTLL